MVLAALLTTATTVLVGCAAHPAEKDEVSLVMAEAFPDTHPVGAGGSVPFVDYIAEHGGDVGLEIEHYPAGQLGAQEEIPDLLRSGAIDIGYIIPSYNVDELPLANVGDLPGITKDSCRRADALIPMMQPGGTIYENELKAHGFHAMWGVAIPELEIATSKKPVETPDDARGLMIAGAGGTTDRVLAGLGAASVPMTGADYYEAIARNTVDGVQTGKYVLKSYGVMDVINYVTRGANLGATTAYLGISSDAWDGLDDAQRKVLREASAVAQKGTCKSVKAADEEAIGDMEGAGVQFADIRSDDRAEWDSVLDRVRDSWAEAGEESGIPAARTLDELERRVKEVEEK